jgi:hypothetical protein
MVEDLVVIRPVRGLVLGCSCYLHIAVCNLCPGVGFSGSEQRKGPHQIGKAWIRLWWVDPLSWVEELRSLLSTIRSSACNSAIGVEEKDPMAVEMDIVIELTPLIITTKKR